LERIAKICLQHNLTICSDEIHADFVYDGAKHIPIASLSPEVANRTITLFSPAKSFNVAGISFSFAVIPDTGLRKRYEKAEQGLVPRPGALGHTMAIAALRDCDGWFEQLLPYLQANRDAAARFVGEEMPGVTMTPLEGTYLAWLDCRDAKVFGTPHEFFLKQAKVATVDGAVFGAGGQGFARLNLACPRERMLEGLERMRAALERSPWTIS
ncbi:aminotransferase class I/II-fold pyridoxal phosphate-dependent enzyme, partial [Candidatus Bipolaricaulota bacterium]|nr:aminotransferase class I/II-fold pyridoxal phosphate-dependent enzyme [Candidatus Bipolaricaulota bacterium]